MRTKLIILALFIALVLSIPYTAMHFTDEVNWGAEDFLVAAVLLSTLGVSVNLFKNRIHNRKKLVATLTISVLIFLFVWAELAVGIFDSPWSGS